MGAGMGLVPGLCHHDDGLFSKRGAELYSQQFVGPIFIELVNPRHAGSALQAASQPNSVVALSCFVKFPLGLGIC